MLILTSFVIKMVVQYLLSKFAFLAKECLITVSIYLDSVSTLYLPTYIPTYLPTYVASDTLFDCYLLT